ncbi:MAG: hypothetical protein ABEK01_05560 [Candidatus Nanohaloarchaea archaeon]
MEQLKRHTDRLDEEGGRELAEKMKDEGLSVVMVYFTTVHHSERELEEFVAALKDEMGRETELVGVSVAGFMSDGTQGLMTSGALAVGLSGIETSTEELGEDPWTASEERIEEFYRENTGEGEMSVVFRPGGRRAGGEDLRNRIEDQITNFFQKPDRRESIVAEIRDELVESGTGLAFRTWNAFYDLVEEEEEFLVNNSLDAGDWEKGYEAINGELRSSDGFYILNLPEDRLEISQVLPPTDENMDELEIVMESRDFRKTGNLIHEIDGKTITDIKEEYPIASSDLGKGGFSYYMLLSMEDQRDAIGSIELPVLMAAFDLEDLKEIHLVRAAHWDRYRSAVEESLDQIGEEEPVQLNVHVSKLNFFRNNTDRLRELMEKRFRDWNLVIGDSFAMEKYRNFMYPTLVVYNTD